MRTWTKIVEKADETTDDGLRAEIAKLSHQLPFRWRHKDGSTHYKNYRLEDFIKDKDHAWLVGCLGSIISDLDFLKKNPKNILQRHIVSPMPPRKKKTLQAMIANIGSSYKKWFRAEYPDDKFDQNDLDGFDDYLRDQLSVAARPDGLIEFWVLDRATEKAIGALPVVLFHYTSSSLVKAIKADGLQSGMSSINGRESDGVYLTTETSGPAIRGYALRARSAHGGYPVCVIVKTFLHEIEPDPDDADISSGRHQFRVDHVHPDRIIKVERATI